MVWLSLIRFTYCHTLFSIELHDPQDVSCRKSDLYGALGPLGEAALQGESRDVGIVSRSPKNIQKVLLCLRKWCFFWNKCSSFFFGGCLPPKNLLSHQKRPNNTKTIKVNWSHRFWPFLDSEEIAVLKGLGLLVPPNGCGATGAKQICPSGVEGDKGGKLQVVIGCFFVVNQWKGKGKPKQIHFLSSNYCDCTLDLIFARPLYFQVFGKADMLNQLVHKAAQLLRFSTVYQTFPW